MWTVLSNWVKRYFSDPEAITMLAILIAGYFVLESMGYVLAPIITSVIIAYVLSAAVRHLERWHLVRWISVSVVFLLFLGMVFFLLFWLLPLIWDELTSLFATVPDTLNRGQNLLMDLQTKYPSIISVNKVKQFISGWEGYISSFGKFLLSFSLASINGLVTLVVYLILVPLMSFFFLKDSNKILAWLGKFLPRRRLFLQEVWGELNYKIGSYVKGKILEMFVVAVIVTLVFALMGLQYAILLGVLVGISMLIPYAGVTLVSIPIVVVALLQWGWSAHFFYLILIYSVVIALEANVLVPVLFSETMDLHPIVIILAVLFFGGLWGFWGIFFAIPLATLVHVLLKAWPRKDVEEIDAF